MLASRYDLDGEKLKEAIVETFNHRKTRFEDIVAFEEGFTDDVIRQGRWNAFIKKKKALINIGFEETMQLLKELLLPIVNSINGNNSFDRMWSKDTKNWE